MILYFVADSKNCADNFVRLLVGKVSNTGYEGWNKDDAHRRQCKELGIFEDVWPENGGPLPWRLTKVQRLQLDRRMSRVLWPHYVEPLYYKRCSFWKKPGRMWKARRKWRLLYFMLPTQLRDVVPAFTTALLLFAWSMRQLLGQTHSYEFAKVLGILPGSRTLFKAFIKKIGEDLRRSLALFEGCTPIDHLKPVFHHFVHLAKLTEEFSLLDILWMMGFERYNKHLKNHVRNPQCPNLNMAKNTVMTDTSNYISLLEEDDLYDLSAQDYHRCFLSMRGLRDEVLSELELADLRILGAQA